MHRFGLHEDAGREHQRALAQQLGGRHGRPVDGEDDRLGELVLHQVDVRRGGIDAGEFGSAQDDQVDGEAPGEVLEDGGQKVGGRLPPIEGGEDQIDAENPHRLLLQEVAGIEQIDVQDDVVRRPAEHGLEADADPAVALVGAGEVARRHGVGKGEEARLRAPAGSQAFEQEGVFVLQHALEAVARHVAGHLAVDRVAERHVVCRDGAGHGARRAAGLEEPVRHLLAGADFGQRSVDRRVEIDRQRLGMGVLFGIGHARTLTWRRASVKGAASPPFSVQR